MPPQSTPTPTPENTPPAGETAENINVPKEAQPEMVPQPVSPEAPRTETFHDQAVAQQPQPQAPIVPEPTDPPIEPSAEVEEAEQQEVDKKGDIDKKWIIAAETIKEKDKDRPYEEEEDAEKLNIDYQHKTFGKEIKKDNEV